MKARTAVNGNSVPHLPARLHPLTRFFSIIPHFLLLWEWTVKETLRLYFVENSRKDKKPTLQTSLVFFRVLIFFCFVFGSKKYIPYGYKQFLCWVMLYAHKSDKKQKCHCLCVVAFKLNVTLQCYWLLESVNLFRSTNQMLCTYTVSRCRWKASKRNKLAIWFMYFI